MSPFSFMFLKSGSCNFKIIIQCFFKRHGIVRKLTIMFELFHVFSNMPLETVLEKMEKQKWLIMYIPKDFKFEGIEK